MFECPSIYLMWMLYNRQAYEQNLEERISDIMEKSVGYEIWSTMEMCEIYKSTDRGCLHNYHVFI